jgi:hypothetical protein
MVNRSDDGLPSLPQALYTPRAGPQEEPAGGFHIGLRPNHCATAVVCRQRTWRRRDTDMGLPDDEQRVLDAIEYQLLADDPQLFDCFSALGSLTPPVKPLDGWWSSASHGKKARHRTKARRGPRQATDNQVFRIAFELVLVIIAIVGVVMLILGAVWMLAALSH